MNYLANIDYAIFIAYLLLLVAIGLYFFRKASTNIEHYYIGGRNLPWWALGISGMASWFDISGTLLITSFVYLLGPRGLFIELRGGVGLVLVVMMLWAGKYHRRSGVLTGSDWMIFRFGDGWGGRFAELAKTIAAVVGIIGELSYLIYGGGLFLSMFLPFSPPMCSLILVSVTALYTMLSGFYGVVVTDIFKSVLVFIGIITASVMAYTKIGSSQELSDIAVAVTGNKDWISSTPSWHTHMPKGYEAFGHLMLFGIFYMLRNVFFGMGMGDDPRYLGAKSDRECGKLTIFWTVLLMFRWPMIMGFAVIGIYLVHEFFPDQGILIQAAELVKNSVLNINHENWNLIITDIVKNPENYKPEFIAQLQTMFGETWQAKLHLVSFDGTVNPEKIVPAVLLFNIKEGFRGLLLVSLIAAGMSSFDGKVNWVGGFIVRNLYQRYARPKASNREMIVTSWVTTIVVITLAFLLSYTIRSINEIWGWIAMALGGGLIVPTVLRMYWWRFNGGGFAIGTIVGLLAAVGHYVVTSFAKVSSPELYDVWNNDIFKFIFTLVFGLSASIIGTFLTKPTDRDVLENFYRKTRPFGFWKPLKSILSDDQLHVMNREHKFDLLALPFAVTFHITLFMLPMQFIIKAWSSMAVTSIFFTVGVLGMYFLWWRNLPADDFVKPPAASKKN